MYVERKYPVCCPVQNGDLFQDSPVQTLWVGKTIAFFGWTAMPPIQQRQHRQHRQQRHARPRGWLPMGSENDTDDNHQTRREAPDHERGESTSSQTVQRLRPVSPASAPVPYTPEREVDDGESSTPSPASNNNPHQAVLQNDSDSNADTTESSSKLHYGSSAHSAKSEGVREGLFRRVKEVAAAVRRTDKGEHRSTSASDWEGNDKKSDMAFDDGFSEFFPAEPSLGSARQINDNDLVLSEKKRVGRKHGDKRKALYTDERSQSDLLPRINRPDRQDKSEHSDFADRIDRCDRYEPRSFSSTDASSSSSSLTSGTFRAPEVRMPDRERSTASGASAMSSGAILGVAGMDMASPMHFPDNIGGRALRSGDRGQLQRNSSRVDSAGSQPLGHVAGDSANSATGDGGERSAQIYSRGPTDTHASHAYIYEQSVSEGSSDGNPRDEQPRTNIILEQREAEINEMMSSEAGFSVPSSSKDEPSLAKSSTVASADDTGEIGDGSSSENIEYVAPFDDSSDEEDLNDDRGGGLEGSSNFDNSRGRSLSGVAADKQQMDVHIPPWSMFHRLQGSLEAIEKSLLDNSTSPEHAEREMLLTARFVLGSRSPEVASDRRSALVKSNVLKAITMIMQKFCKNVRLSTVGCSVISALATGDSAVQKAFGAAGAVQVVVDCIESNQDEDEQMTEAALRALSTLTWVPENRDVIRVQRGIDVIVSTMGKHGPSPSIQTEGATLLANCAYESEENKRVIADNFGIDLIITAMKQFQHDIELQSRACLALRNLTYGMPAIAEITGSKGGIAAVMSAMDLHGEDPGVIEQGAVALYNMVRDSAGNVERMLDNSVYPEILLTALQRFSESDVIQCSILRIIQAITRKKHITVTHLAQAGGIRILISSMRASITRPSVLHEGAAALHAAFSAKAKRSQLESCLLEVGGIDTLFELLFIAVTSPKDRSHC